MLKKYRQILRGNEIYFDSTQISDDLNLSNVYTRSLIPSDNVCDMRTN